MIRILLLSTTSYVTPAMIWGMRERVLQGFKL
jgi:hypothetical protein